MANEVEVFEQSLPSSGFPLRKMPPIAKQVLDITELSAAFNRSTGMVTIITNTACRVQFSLAAGTDPDGSNGPTFPLAANVPYDFEVVAGRKVIAVAA